MRSLLLLLLASLLLPLPPAVAAPPAPPRSGDPEVCPAANDGTLEARLVDGIKVYVPDGSENISLTLDGVDLRRALRTVADIAGASLVMQDGVQGTVSVRLRAVHYERALEMLALSAGFGLNRTADRTYMIGDLKTVSTAAGAAGHRVYRLRHLKAADLASRVAALYGKRLDFRTVVTHAEDVLLVSAGAKALDEIGNLVGDLDVAPPNVKCVFTLVRIASGPGGKDLETLLAGFDTVSSSGILARVVNSHEQPLGKGADGVERHAIVGTEFLLLPVAAGHGEISLMLEGKFKVDEAGGKDDLGARRMVQEIKAAVVAREGERRDVAIYRESSGATLALRLVATVERPAGR